MVDPFPPIDIQAASHPPSVGESDDTRRRSRFSLILNIVVSVSVLLACWAGYVILGQREKPQRAKPPKSLVTIVQTEELRLHDGPVRIQTDGVVVPLREIRLATEVAGRITKQSPNLRAGRSVRQGEVLIQLDPIDYQLEIDRLEAQLGQEAAEVNTVQVSIENTSQLLELAKQQVSLAASEFARILSLIQRQAASTTEADAAKRAELAATASLVELQNRRRELNAQAKLIAEKQSLTQVQLRRAKLNLERCIVKSPLHGRVVTCSVEEQSYVTAGTSFVTIEDTSAVEIRSQLTADQMVWVWRSGASSSPQGGDSDADAMKAETMKADSMKNERLSVTGVPDIPATISYTFGSESHRWSAVLERIDGIGIDTPTRTYPCLLRVDAPEQSESVGDPKSLTRGMFVRVSLETRPNQTLYEVDESAIRPGNRVWLNVRGRLRVVPITVVSRSDLGVVVELQPLPGASQTDMVESPWIGEPPANLGVIVSPISDPLDGMAIESSATRAASVRARNFVSGITGKAVHR